MNCAAMRCSAYLHISKGMKLLSNSILAFSCFEVGIQDINQADFSLPWPAVAINVSEFRFLHLRLSQQFGSSCV